MLILDVTVVTIAIPQLGHELQMGRESLTWVMSAYTLAFGGLILVGGRLADLFGARRLVIVGLALFTLASLVAGLSTDAPTILGARAAQGVGAALLSPRSAGPRRPGGVTGDGDAQTADNEPHPSPHNPRKRFALHYAQMVVAMLVGMVTLYPLWETATGSAPGSSWANRAEVECWRWRPR